MPKPPNESMVMPNKTFEQLITEISPLDLSEVEDPTEAVDTEIDGPQGMLSQLMKQGNFSSGQKMPKMEEIYQKRQMIDDAMRNIIAKKSQPRQGPTNFEIMRNASPRGTVGDLGEYYKNLALADRQDALEADQRELVPLEGELARAQAQYGFLNEDRKYAADDLNQNMDWALKFLANSGKQAPTYNVTEIRNPDGTKQKVAVNRKDPNDRVPIGEPSKPSITNGELKLYEGHKEKMSAFEGMEPVFESLKELAPKFGQVSFSPDTRAAIDQATGGWIPGMFPGDTAANDAFTEYSSKVSELVLNQAENLKGAISDKDIAFLKDGTGSAKMKPEARVKRLNEIIFKLKKAYENSATRAKYFEDKYDLGSIADSAAAENEALVEQLQDKDLDDEIQAIQSQLGGM